MTSPDRTPLQEVAALLRARGVVLSVAPGEYVLNWPNGGAATELRVGDLEEAVACGLAMGGAPKQPPPLGPMGTRNGLRRARMYAHNRRLAARRRKGSGGSD